MDCRGRSRAGEPDALRPTRYPARRGATGAGETDAVLGSPEDVRRFLLQASQRLPFGLVARAGDRYDLLPGELPEAVRLRLGDVPAPWPITFRSPTPAGLTYVGRNHPLVEGLAEHLMDLAFHPNSEEHPVARCGVVRTPLVARRTALFLLRLRYLHLDATLVPDTSGHEGAASLAEETLAWGLRGIHPDVSELEPTEALRLLDGPLDAVSVLSPSARKYCARRWAGGRCWRNRWRRCWRSGPRGWLKSTGGWRIWWIPPRS